MNKHFVGLPSFGIRIALAILILLGGISLSAQPAQAGSGTTVDIPASGIVPVMDGVCNPSEYADAVQAMITVGPSTFPVYMKQTANDAYFCFGDASGLPLSATSTPQVAVYIDPNDDGSNTLNDDYVVKMPYDPLGVATAASWGAGFYTGTDPILGEWQAVKYQTSVPDFWTVEFRISRQALGGWNHTVGVSLFYHWWRYQGDDYSWPANGIWASPQWWGNARFTTVDVRTSSIIPSVDGLCGLLEYADATTLTIPGPNGNISAYLKHSAANLYVCLDNLTVPALGLQDGPNAALFINRNGNGGGAPGVNDLYFTISYNGTGQSSSGNGVGFSGPDPGGHVIARSQQNGVWSAEYQISDAVIGRLFLHQINLAVAEQQVTTANDSYGWPNGFSNLVPNSWGLANLTGLSLYLPVLSK